MSTESIFNDDWEGAPLPGDEDFGLESSAKHFPDDPRCEQPIADGEPGSSGSKQNTQSRTDCSNDIELFSLKSLWPSTLAVYEKRKADGHEPISTGIVSLDSLLGGGYERSQVTILIGGPGCGKTAKAASDALSAARKGIPAIYLSHELPVDILIARLTSLEESVPWREVARGNKNDTCAHALQKQIDLPFYIFDCDSIKNFDEFESAVTNIANIHGTSPFVVVDYLQMAARKIGKVKDIRDSVEVASEKLRLLAIHAQASILVISQAGRSSYNLLGNDGKPNLDLVIRSAKESGGVEYDAGALIAIVPANESDPDPRKRKMWFAIAKNRMGNGLGSIPVCFDGLSGWFTEISENDMPHPSKEDGRDYESEVLKVITESELQDGDPISSLDNLRARVAGKKIHVEEAVESLKKQRRIKKSGKYFHTYEWKPDTDTHICAQLEKSDPTKTEKSTENFQNSQPIQADRKKSDPDPDPYNGRNGSEDFQSSSDRSLTMERKQGPDPTVGPNIRETFQKDIVFSDPSDPSVGPILCGYMSDNVVECSRKSKRGMTC